INGYPDDAPLPSYRVIPAHVKGNVTNNAYSYSDHPLPTMHLTKEQRKRLEELEMRDSIAVLEGLAKHDTKGLQRPLPVEYAAFFNKALSGGYKVQQAWCDIGIGRFAQITAQVRSKLLDFLLDVSEKVGADMSDEAVKRVAQSPETGSKLFGDRPRFPSPDQGRLLIRNRSYRQTSGVMQQRVALHLRQQQPGSAVE
ncbi:MAG TPA: hypothetical protein PLK97_08645, partial [Pseudomonadales bacterium]|nr:hypothetical protein [Pseudomonadales bacterium]